MPCFPLFNTCTRNFSAFCTQSCTSVCALPKSFKYRTGSALMPAAFVPNLLVMSQPVNTCVAGRTSHIGFPTFTAITYRSPHFSFPWRRPCDNHAICCMDGKTIQCLPNPSQHEPIYLQQFPSYTMLKSMRKSKNRYFYHILFPLGTPMGQSC